MRGSSQIVTSMAEHLPGRQHPCSEPCPASIIPVIISDLFSPVRSRARGGGESGAAGPMRLGPTGLQRCAGGVHTAEVDGFVGRTDRAEVLEAELQAVRSGRPRVVLVEGEAGSANPACCRGSSPGTAMCACCGPAATRRRCSSTGDSRTTPGRCRAGGCGRILARPGRRGGKSDAMAVGAQLVAVLGDLQAGQQGRRGGGR